ncbi:hypothetical protein GGR53DRAFT_507307 [Hypoxylon sp. FL1150]|nr:hypothetical protein GGR53DRAFT_507307 [Hypoxylon sp. FL1150]
MCLGRDILLLSCLLVFEGISGDGEKELHEYRKVSFGHDMTHRIIDEFSKTFLTNGEAERTQHDHPKPFYGSALNFSFIRLFFLLVLSLGSWGVVVCRVLSRLISQ